MELLIISFLVGICGIFIFSTIPNIFIIGILAVVVFSLMLCKLYKNNFSIIAFGCLFGLFWVMLFANNYTHKLLPKDLEKKSIVITGVVISIPEINKRYQHFLFQTKTIGLNRDSRLLNLYWYNTKNIVSSGELWKFVVRLKRPHGFANSGGFDYEKQAFEKGINATGGVVDFANNTKLGVNWYHCLLLHIRQNIDKKIIKSVGDKPLSSFLTAIAIGDRSQVTKEQWKILRKTGTNHLIAVAGLHIGLLCGFIYFVFSFIWRRFSVLILKIPAQTIATICSLFFGWMYSLLAGFSLPTERASMMLTVGLGAFIAKRYFPLWYAILIALAVVLFLDPLSVLSESFWLSFVAVTVIFYGMLERNGKINVFIDLIKIQFVLGLGLLPLCVWFYHTINWITPFANMIAVPLFGLVVIPCVFVGVIFSFFNFSATKFIFSICIYVLNILWNILVVFSKFPMMNINYYMNSICQLLFFIIAIFIILAPTGIGFWNRSISIFFLFPIIFFHQDGSNKNTAKFSLLDVGQGLSAVIETQNHVLVFDSGPKIGLDSDTGEAVVVPFLQSQHINKIDTMILSHGDEDHIGGANSIINQINVGQILSSAPLDQITFSNKHNCYAGQHWNWDGVSFDILWPLKDTKYDGNNSSCVLKISISDKSILLTGDIEAVAEDQIIKNNEKILSSTILVAPHHGSATSSSDQFVNAVKPKYVLFPVGYLNKFNFPNNNVIDKYEKSGAAMLQTDKTGEITFLLNSRKLNIPKIYRIDNRHVWN